MILRWHSRPPGRRKSCLLELRPTWDKEGRRWERLGPRVWASCPSQGVLGMHVQEHRAGPSCTSLSSDVHDKSPCGAPVSCSPCTPCTPQLTNMARSSMLLGSSRRPPKRKVFCRFCSQALAIPAETWSQGLAHHRQWERGSLATSHDLTGFSPQPVGHWLLSTTCGAVITLPFDG